MRKQIKSIIQGNGITMLETPDELCSALLEQGVAQRHVYALLTILKCCPTVTAVLTQGEVSAVEANTLLRNVVLQTGLSVGTARYVLGCVLYGCGANIEWNLHLSIEDKFFDKQVMPGTSQDSVVSELIQRLKAEQEDSAVFSDLHNLAAAGNAQAAYALGMYYKEQDDLDGEDRGRQYFEQANRLGYGPAAGALAYYELHGKKKFMWRIAQRFQHPAALTGKEGREWASLAQELLNYREENVARLRSMLVTQVLVFIMTAVLVNVLPCGFWGGAAVVLQAVGLVWMGICCLWQQYHSARTACYLMMLSWVILALAAF